jgi:large subunit ribosomal protein L4
MKMKMVTLDNKAAGEIELNDKVFGLEVRKDLLHRMVNWQLAKRQSGTHKTKGISEIAGTTAKPFKQKGTGNARQGSRRATQMRGGATVFGPVVRSHAIAMPKKVRKLALKTALSSKQKEGKLRVIDAATLKDTKTSALVKQFDKLGVKNALFIDGNEVDQNFFRAARNIKHIDVLPQLGANVFDILKHDEVVLTKAAVEALEARL